MNERIEELAEEAMEEKLSLEEFIVALKNEPHDFYGFRRHELEKFALLIVKECANIVDNDDTSYPYNSFGDKIKNHFGAE